jgi:hypothetical protein
MEDRTMNSNTELIKPPMRKAAKKVSFAAPRVVQVPARKAKDPNHIVVINESDCKDFLQISTGPNNRLSHLHTVEIHLNGGQHSEYVDDYLAMALNQFHFRSDGINPHQLNCLKLVISGNVLFHRFNYALVSPTVSYEVSNKLHRLMTGDLSIEEKASLAFKVNSTEKAIAKALLGIRGVKNVVIKHQGRAKMEPAFADTIKRTVILPPGVETAPSKIDSTTSQLDHEGVFLSQKMRAQGLCGQKEYPTRNYKITPDSECGKACVLVDETIQLLGHFTNESEETTKLKAMEAAQQVLKRRISPEDYQMIKTTTAAVSRANSNSARALRSAKRRKLDPSTKSADVMAANVAVTAAKNLVAARKSCTAGPKDKVVEDMVRIMSKPQDGEDLVLPKKKGAPSFIDQKVRGMGTKNGEWLVLTGKGGMAQMGWKAH